jgi:hypothetical protein
MWLLLLARYPLHQKIYVPLRPAQRQEFPPHQSRVEAQIPARLVERELPAGAIKDPAIGGYLPTQALPFLAAGRLHLGEPEPAMPPAQFADVIVGPNENFRTKPPPAGLALLDDVLVVVVRYGDGNHYLTGASQ